MPSIIGATRLIKSLKHEQAKRKPKPKGPKVLSYRRRDTRLGDLGYASYQEYLASEDWATIRRAKLAKHPTCFLCHGKACQVHHMSYDDRTMLGLSPHNLITLCDSCHYKIEFDDAGRKRDLREVNKKTRELAFAAGRHRWLANLKRVQRQDRETRRQDDLRAEAIYSRSKRVGRKKQAEREAKRRRKVELKQRER